jgi:Domain of unknown function (DUF397)
MPEPEPLSWRKSSFTGSSGNCVEVGWHCEAVAVRDSKQSDGPMLDFPAAQWHAFLQERSGD